MTEEERNRVLEISKEIKQAIRNTIDKYATEISIINTTNNDPHTPIIGVVQMALAQAATEYMVTNGASAVEAVDAACQTMNNSMQQWVKVIFKIKKPEGQEIS